MSEKLRVYVATNYGMREWVETIVRPALEVRGCEIVSRWHAGPAEDESALSEDEAGRIRANNLADLARAEVCVVYSTERGGEHHAEAAIAYRDAITLVWHGRDILLAKVPGVIRCATVPETFEAVGMIARAKRQRTPTYPPPAMTGTDA